MVVAAIVFVKITNPFSRFSIVKDPLRDFDLKGNIDRYDVHHLLVRTNIFFRWFALFKSATHILGNAWIRQAPTRLTSLSAIIKQIHHLRFDPTLPFLISGDHFSSLYPRSLGIFYYSMLDPRIPSTKQDWENRQLIYAKTLHYALKVFSQTKRLATTIVPISPHSVTPLNIYAYPSDTLYSLLVAFENVLESEAIRTRYPYSSGSKYTLKTKRYAKALLGKFRKMLKRHWETYSSDIIDTKTGLVSKSMLLSGTKDIAKRECAFYDNVVYWKTYELAQKLGLTPENAGKLAKLKKRILNTFWDGKNALFLEDLSSHSRVDHLTSSDWLIAYQVGFLSPSIKSECAYLVKAVNTIIDSGLDQPFGLSYHKDIREWQPYLPVRLAAPMYGSKVIWSHWGIEYTKLLIHLGRLTGNSRFILQAKAQYRRYEENIRQTGGYPEVYDPSGKPYAHHGYTSVYQTGWIINFEQLRAMMHGLTHLT